MWSSLKLTGLSFSSLLDILAFEVKEDLGRDFDLEIEPILFLLRIISLEVWLNLTWLFDLLFKILVEEEQTSATASGIITQC